MIRAWIRWHGGGTVGIMMPGFKLIRPANPDSELHDRPKLTNGRKFVQTM
jgi:hypothetical protein